MKTTMFLPKEIKVGYQERPDTYTGKLGYVVSVEKNGKVRKEISFESWRNKNIPTNQFENEPISGFVLNRKAGGYATGWNHRKTYVRVHDPRGFEFEISVDNLLYILENTSCIVGKGLEGEFVYAWSGKDLVLLPVTAPEYKVIHNREKKIEEQEFVKAQDLEVGHTYLTFDKRYLVYLGKFYEYKYEKFRMVSQTKSKQPFHFCEIVPRENGKVEFKTHRLTTIKQHLRMAVDKSEHPFLSEMMESLSREREFSPIDLSKTVNEPMTLEYFLELFNGNLSCHLYAKNRKEYVVRDEWGGNQIFFQSLHETNYVGGVNLLLNTYEGKKYKVTTLEEVFHVLKPTLTKIYLTNGHLYEERLHPVSNGY